MADMAPRNKTSTQIRYVPKGPFMVRLNGVRYVFNPDHVDGKTGLPGYDALPKGLSKEQRASFRTIKAEVAVEQASAAPGELRAAAVRKAKASDDGPETVDDDG